jgi:NAD(P)-dependent dehydrogenase (short-subunit alcohol dehydrogenase family)
MDLALTDRRALVTGSSSGIGSGIVEALAAEGAWVAVHGRDEARAQAMAAGLRDRGARVVVAIGDLTTDEGANAVAAVIEGVMGGLDILVNNVGGKTNAGYPDWLEVPMTEWVATWKQNVGAAVRMIHRFVPGMRERGFGRVVQIASASALQPEPAIGEYQSAKAAIVNLTASLSRALGRTGITVNTVSPGTIVTPAVRAWLDEVSAQRGWGDDWGVIQRRFIDEMIPLTVNALGQPQDVGRVVALLASPLSGYINGANVRVDGGQVRGL